ncbi:MAG: four helix bundle protein [Candidatus Shapirobacteria bacterium]
MGFERFEEILSWKKARELNIVVYKLFGTCRDFSFKDQICRASVSIMNNIAEGYERKTNLEFKRFLYISKGSCGEVRSMLYLANDLGYIDGGMMVNLSDMCIEISKMLSGLIKSL